MRVVDVGAARCWQLAAWCERVDMTRMGGRALGEGFVVIVNMRCEVKLDLKSPDH